MAPPIENPLERKVRVNSNLAVVGALVLLVGLGIELIFAIADAPSKLWNVVANIFVFGGVGAEVLFSHFARVAADALSTE